MAVGGIAGPASAGVLVVTVGAGRALVLDGLTFVGAAALLTRLRDYDLGTAKVKATFWRDLGRGLRRRARANAATRVPAVPRRARPDRRGGGARRRVGVRAHSRRATASRAVLGNIVALRVRPQLPLAAAYGVIFLAFPSVVLLGRSRGHDRAVRRRRGTAIGLSSALWETTMQRNVWPDAPSRVASFDRRDSTALRPVGLALLGPSPSPSAPARRLSARGSRSRSATR